MNLNNFPEGFLVKTKEFFGESLTLIVSGIGVEYTKDNLIFRSSVWNSKGEPVSLSFKKFFNWDERLDLAPIPDIKNISLLEKLDGSTLIVSKYKGHLILRTRGSFDAREQANGFELDSFLKNYPIDSLEEGNTWNNSYIFEWYSPHNKIVLDYGAEPLLWLTNIVCHNNYEYKTQAEVDTFAEKHGFKRPKRYTFKSIKEMLDTVKALEGIEGICCYYNNDQEIRKVKSAQYLSLHAFRSECNIKTILDLFVLLRYPSYSDLYKHIEKTFDFECAQMALPFIERVCNAWKEVQKELDDIRSFVSNLKGLTRKEAAEKIQGVYGRTTQAGIAFSFLSGKGLEEIAKPIKTLLLQKLG